MNQLEKKSHFPGRNKTSLKLNTTAIMFLNVFFVIFGFENSLLFVFYLSRCLDCCAWRHSLSRFTTISMVDMLNVVYAQYFKYALYAECHYAECHFADDIQHNNLC